MVGTTTITGSKRFRHIWATVARVRILPGYDANNVSCPFPTPRSHLAAFKNFSLHSHPRSHLSSLRLEVVVVEPEGELRRVSGRLHTHTPSSQTPRLARDGDQTRGVLHETEIRQEGWDLVARTGDCVDTEANPDGIKNTATQHPSLLSDTSNG